MNVLLPSEIARLVLGYLTSVKCSAAREKFLEECPHLREYVFYLGNGHEYPTNISGYDLIHYLNIGFQYTQFITCGESIKFPLPSAASYYGFQNRAFASGPTGQESPAQARPVPSGTPLTSPRTNQPPYRTPRTVWANASPATDRRSPADGIIDVTTVTEPPSSEPQIPPPKRLSEVAIQTEDLENQEGIPSQLAVCGPIASQPSTPHSAVCGDALSQQSRPPLPSQSQQLQLHHPPAQALQQKSQMIPLQHHPQQALQNELDQTQCMQPTQQFQQQAHEIEPQQRKLESQITGQPEHPELMHRQGQISTLVSSNLQLVPPHQFALPNVPTSTPQASGRAQQQLRKEAQMELSIGFPQCFSPKRKPTAPKRRSFGTPLDMFTSPPSLDPTSTKKAIDELVQNQLAEKIAESINEATTVLRPPPMAEESCQSLLGCGSNLPDSLLSDVISKTLSDPIMEELAQYVVIQSNTIDLETPTGTPLKGSALKTPFKQIAEDMARQGTSGSGDFGQAGHTQMNASSDSHSFLSTGFISQTPVSTINAPQTAPATESMKIVVDSSFSRNPPKTPMLRTLMAPRKPSPKVSPPGSTSSTLVDERTTQGDSSRSNPSTTASMTSFSINQIKPIPGTHIRTLDFGVAPSKPGSSADAEKQRPVKSRKRKSPVVSEELPPKAKRTSSRSRGQPNSFDHVTAPTSEPASTKTGHVPSIEVTTAAPSATTYSLPTGFNGGDQTVKPPVIVSIPDSPQPKVNPESPKKARPSTNGSQRRQAILVEAVPPSKKTTPKRVSSSRAKPRPRTSVTSKPSHNETSTTKNVTDFIMPSTPKKIPGPSAASVRANGRLNKPRNAGIIASETHHSLSKPSTAVPVASSGVANPPPVTAPSKNGEFNIDIAALLDKVHKIR